jgi:hypothetical protein
MRRVTACIVLGVVTFFCLPACRTGPDRIGPDRTGSDRIGPDRTGSSRA